MSLLHWHRHGRSRTRSLARLTWCSTSCYMLGVLGCVSCGACQHSLFLWLLHPHLATSLRQPNTSSSVLGALVSFCAGTGKGTSVLEMVTTFEAATGVQLYVTFCQGQPQGVSLPPPPHDHRACIVPKLLTNARTGLLSPFSHGA